MQTRLTDIRQKWSRAKPTKTITVWLIAGAILLTIFLGFTRGDWTTDARALHLAETSAQDAVVARLAPMCVAQFNADPQRTVKLEELKAMSSFQRGAYVKDQGWATMPGEAGPDNRVTNECVKQLMLINE